MSRTLEANLIREARLNQWWLLLGAGLFFVFSVGIVSPVGKETLRIFEAGYRWCLAILADARTAGSTPGIEATAYLLLSLPVLSTLYQGWRLWRNTRQVLARMEGWPRAPLPARYRQAARRLGVDQQVVMILHPAPVALTAGFVRPKIWVSDWLVRNLTVEQFAAVLAHEQYHLLRRDSLRTLLVDSLGKGLRFLPLVRAMQERHHWLKEFAADQHAVHRLRGSHPQAPALLAAAMLKMLDFQDGPQDGRPELAGRDTCRVSGRGEPPFYGAGTVSPPSVSFLAPGMKSSLTTERLARLAGLPYSFPPAPWAAALRTAPGLLAFWLVLAGSGGCA